MQNKTQNLNQDSGQNQKQLPKKESLSPVTVKTLLAVIIFAGMGTIIIGGGCIVWEYSKNKTSNKIVKPVNQETENHYDVLEEKCDGDGCCVSSLETMRDNNYKEADENGNCLDGFKMNMQKCITSYQWCEPMETVQEVSLTTDKTEYQQGEEAELIIQNNSEESLFRVKNFCNDIWNLSPTLQKYEQGKWIKYEWYSYYPFPSGDRCNSIFICDEIKNTKKIDLLLKKDLDTLLEEGKYRVGLTFGKSCKSQERNSDYGTFGLSDEFVVYSNEFEIKKITTINDFTWQTYWNEEFGFEVKYPSEFSQQKVFQIEPDGMIFSVGNAIYNFSVSRYSEKYVSEKKAIYTEEYCSRDAGYNDCAFWPTWLNEWNGDSKIFISKSNDDSCKKEWDSIKRCFDCEIVLFDNKKAIKKMIYPLPNGDYFYWRLTVEKESSRFYLDLALNFYELAKIEHIDTRDFSLRQLILDQKDKEAKKIFNQILSTFKFIEKKDDVNWQTYRNEEFEFQYPEDWEKNEKGGVNNGEIGNFRYCDGPGCSYFKCPKAEITENNSDDKTFPMIKKSPTEYELLCPEKQTIIRDDGLKIETCDFRVYQGEISDYSIKPFCIQSTTRKSCIFLYTTTQLNEMTDYKWDQFKPYVGFDINKQLEEEYRDISERILSTFKFIEK